MEKIIRQLLQRFLLVAAACSILTPMGWAGDESQSDVTQRLDASAKVLNEVMADPQKAIPDGIIRRATCVAVFPSTVQVAVLVGAKHGKGFATCRAGSGWSAPAPLDISGGSWGAQLGGEAIDLVIIVTDEKGMQQLESGKFRMGVETSVTAGPVGEHSMTINVDAVSYARTRGVFAGTNITGSSITEDEGNARALYGSSMSLADILSGKAQPPDTGASFLDTVQKYAGQTKPQQ
jgi:lipid-binding SYLF domain-containing protein